MLCRNIGCETLLKLRTKTIADISLGHKQPHSASLRRHYGSITRCQVWMCGGTLLIVTCSHVGHVFRKATPYSFPGGTGHIINHNNARLADVWMDDWRSFFYRISPGSIHQMAASCVHVCSAIARFFTSFPIA